MELWRIRSALVLALVLMCALPHCLSGMSTFRMDPPVDLLGNVQVGYADSPGTERLVSGAGRNPRDEDDPDELPIPESPEEEMDPAGGPPEAIPLATIKPIIMDGPAGSWTGPGGPAPAPLTRKSLIVDGPAEGWVGNGGPPEAIHLATIKPIIMDGPADLWFGRFSTPSPPPSAVTDAPLGMDGPGDQWVQPGNPESVSPPAPTLD